MRKTLDREQVKLISDEKVERNVLKDLKWYYLVISYILLLEEVRLNLPESLLVIGTSGIWDIWSREKSIATK